MKVLVIGKSSYIGNSFKAYMEKHSPVDIQIDTTGAANGEWKSVDLSIYDSILHVAALVHKKETVDMEKEYDEVNHLFPMEVARRAKENGVRQFVFLSTMAVYGDEQPMITKYTKEEPKTLYGKSKYRTECELKKIADSNFRVAVIRPPMVYGWRCPGNYGRLERLSRKLPVFFRVGNQRSMIYIENLCECLKQIIVSQSNISNIGVDNYDIIKPQNVEYVDTGILFQTIRKALGKRTILIPFGKHFFSLLARKNKTIQKVFGDCCYEKNESNSKYQKVNFEESIERTVTGMK